MKDWIKNRKEGKIKSAIQSAMTRYKEIEEAHNLLDRVAGLFETEALDLNDLVENKGFNLYAGKDCVELYAPTWKTDADKQKGTMPDLLIAATEVFGEGKRSVYGTDMIQYEWNNILDGKTFRIQVNADAAGCQIVEEEVEVSEKTIPAHTEKQRIIKCGNME